MKPSFLLSHQRALSPVALAVMALSTTGLAHAQDTAANGGTLPQVEVKAEAGSPVKVEQSANPKFTAPLLDTPKSVSVIPEQVIQQTGSTTLQDALRLTPGVTFGAGEGGNSAGDRPFIRGFDSQSDMYLDGIRDVGSQTREVFNIEQVEVIKGPSSAFGGRGSAGGSVNIVSKTPKAENFVTGSAGLGNAKYKRATLDVNHVFTPEVAGRLNLMVNDQNVAGRDAVQYKRWGIAPSLTLGLNSPTKLTLSYYHLQTDDMPDAGGFPYSNPFAATNANASLNGNGSPMVPNRRNYYGLVDRDFQKTKANIGTIDLSHDFGNDLVARNTLRLGRTTNNYLWTQPDDSKGNPLLYGTLWRRTNSRAATTDTVINVTSLTGKAKTGSVEHSFNVGLELSQEKTKRGSYTLSPNTNNPLTGSTSCPTTGAETGYNCTSFENPNPYDPWSATHTVTRTDPANDVRVKTKTQSLYAMDTLTITPQWLINGGLRYDHYDTQLHNPTAAGTPAAPKDLQNKNGFWNYQAGVIYKPVPEGSIYLSYGTSSTPPGMDAGDGADGLSVAVQNLKPQTARNVELGTKWELLDRQLAVTAAIFKTDMNNARVTAEDGTTQNIGKKSVKGFEVGVAGNVTRQVQLFGGYTYLDAKLKNQGFSSGVPSADNGNVFPNTAKHSANLWANYQPIAGLSLGLGATYVGKQYGNTANTKWIPSYVRWDAMVSYALNKNVTLQLNVQNLTDKLYFTKAYASHYAAIAPARTATLTANFKF
ncbi:TonB-dependent receptor [Comamonas serinivorans]|nr:TonB-dependent siderophore receptor [Comamonas serinivorans]